MPRDFPRLHDGDALEPWHLNVVYDELRRLRKFQAAPPLALANGGTDPPILTLMEDFSDLHGVGKVTLQVPARISATVPGKGKFKPYTSFEGAPKTLGDLGGENDIYNMTDKIIALNATIQWKYFLGAFWVDTPGSCADLS